MSEKTRYKTHHTEQITAFFRARPDAVMAAKDVLNAGIPGIGEATVYRILKKLADEGVIEKHMTAAGAVYRYIANDCGCQFHLQCEQCGKVIHMHCHEMQEAQRHIEQEHDFLPSGRKTVISGLCKTCRDKNVQNKR